MMFRQEMFGYSREDVEAYLKKTLARLEDLEKKLDQQKQIIERLEERLTKRDNSDNIEEEAKQNADEIVFHAIEEANDLELRIHQAILQELDKE